MFVLEEDIYFFIVGNVPAIWLQHNCLRMGGGFYFEVAALCVYTLWWINVRRANCPQSRCINKAVSRRMNVLWGDTMAAVVSCVVCVVGFFWHKVFFINEPIFACAHCFLIRAARCQMSDHRNLGPSFCLYERLIHNTVRFKVSELSY